MTTSIDFAAPSGTAVAPVGIRTSALRTVPSAAFQVSSQTTLMGHRSHTVTTREGALAYALYEQALHIDIEPDFFQNKGLWTIGFICDDHERDTALAAVTEEVMLSC